jgi:Fe-S cluster biogenesis protein NfuA
VEEKIQKILSELRPFFEADHGDITLVEVTKDLRVKVALHGACKDCSMKTMTLKAGVEDSIRRAIPEILSVETVD